MSIFNISEHKKGDEIEVVLIRDIIHSEPSGQQATRGQCQTCNAVLIFKEDEPTVPSYSIAGSWRFVPGSVIRNE